MSRHCAPERSPATPAPKMRRSTANRPTPSRQPASARPAEATIADAEREFIEAMHDYKQASGRMFPTWSEVLEVLKALGYAKQP